MILFKITNTPEKSQNGIYSHTQPELIFGRTSGHMVVDDPALGEQQARIYFEGEQSFIVNLYPQVEMKLNGKAVGAAPFPIKERDNLVMGDSTIFFTKINTTQPEPPIFSPDSSLATRFEGDTNEAAILFAIETLRDNAASQQSTASQKAAETTAGAPPPLKLDQMNAGPAVPPKVKK